jgi:hypothetical protein
MRRILHPSQSSKTKSAKNKFGNSVKLESYNEITKLIPRILIKEIFPGLRK